MTAFEIATLVVQGFSGLFVALSLLYTGKQLKANHDWNRRKAAQDATLMYCQVVTGMRSLDDHFSFMTRTDPIPCSEINPVLEEYPEVRASIRDLLNYYEALARGVIQGVYDEEVMRASKRSAAFKAYDKLMPYIRQQRKIFSSPTLWDHFESLVSKWRREEAVLENRPLTDQ